MLEPEYTPPNSITSTEEALSVIHANGLTHPQPSSPYVNLRGWREFHERMVPEVYTSLAEQVSEDISDHFKTLSVRFDPKSPYTYTDIISVDVCESQLSDERVESAYNHINSAIELIFSTLPPVTAGLLGNWVGSVEGYNKEHYKEEILPDDYSWTGMHQPFRRNLQVTVDCWAEYPNSESNPNHTHSCTTIHEFGHAVHYIYGLQRPGDHGYDYPDDKQEFESSGVLQQINLSPHQAEFVLEVLKGYKRQHMYGKLIKYGYERSHPVELFACAFDELVRTGNTAFSEEYPYLVPIMRYLI